MKSVLDVPAVFAALRSLDAEPDRVGVTVTVEITPRACEPTCGGGGGGVIVGGLPVTGLEASGALVWAALALVAFGLVLLQRRRVRAITDSLRVPSRRDSTMSSGVIPSHARPTHPRRTKTGGSREKDDPDIE